MRSLTFLSSFLLLISFYFSGNSQNPTALSLTFDTLAQIKGSYETKLKKFNNDPVHKQCIVFLGNSLTEGAKWNMLFPHLTVLNRGIGGDVTAGVLFRLDEVLRHNPSQIIIEIGTNDLSRGYPTNQIVENFQKIVNRAKAVSPSTTLYIQSLLPINPLVNSSNTAEKQRRILELNHALEEFAMINQVVYIPLHAAFLDEKQNLKKELTTDGLHLNTQGYEVWRDFLKNQKYL